MDVQQIVEVGVMTSHSRLSPGVEIREIDRSGYQKTDYSITGTTVFMCGFADRGEDYTPQWVNTMTTFESLYGSPKNELEWYLWSGAKEVLDKGGVCVVSKLPYSNSSKDHFSAVRYRVLDSAVASGEQIAAISSVDSSLTACLSVVPVDGQETSALVTMDALDGYRTGHGAIGRNEIVIVDVSRGDYGKIDVIGSTGLVVSDDVECLGVLPVITTPANAMFYQGLISSATSCDPGTGVESTRSLSAYQPVSDVRTRFGVRFSSFSQDNFSAPVSAASIYDGCLARYAAEQFPQIGYTLSSTLDRRDLKKIGVAVFKAVKDQSNDNKIGFVLAESFVGSLDRASRDPDTGASDYIGELVNSNSRLINLFSNVRVDDRYKRSQTIAASNAAATVLGFLDSERVKHVSYKDSIVDPLNLVFGRAQDPNQIRIDVVADAGVSNAAAFAAKTEGADATAQVCSSYNGDTYPFLPVPDGSDEVGGWSFADAKGYAGRWQAIVRKFDSFCSSTRRDCMFVADMFRPVVLDGDQKVVRNTDRSSSIEGTLLPRLRYVSGVNSSWSAGYSNWFYAPLGETGDFFWCPPSVKAAGVYVHTDAYFHPWDAPAGMTRGQISQAYDVSFDPRNDEAGRIYQQAWNYAVSYPTEGVVLEGQKTFQLNKTALDRVNVRRLMIWLEKRVAAVARRFLYEGNTAYMRQRFVDAVRPILDEAKSGSGVSEYALRCDDTLNTAQVIDNNELRCIIGIKPVKSIEWVVLNFLISNQSANVSEEVMS